MVKTIYSFSFSPTLFFPHRRRRSTKTSLSFVRLLKKNRYCDPSTDSCRDSPGCHGDPASEDLAWDCGPCTAFLLDGGNGHCERVSGCSLGGSASAAAVLTSAGGRRGGGSQQQQQQRTASASEQKQITEAAERNTVVFNLDGPGSVGVGMPPTGAMRAGARRAGARRAGAPPPSASAPSRSARSPSGR